MANLSISLLLQIVVCDAWIAQLADPQLGMSTAFSDIEPFFHKEFVPFWACMGQIIYMGKSENTKPNFVFIGGDMQDVMPDNKNKQTLAATQREWSLHAITAASTYFKYFEMAVPFYYTPGNHDVGDEPNKQFLEDYTEYWKAPMFQDLTKNPEFRDKNIVAISINSQLYQTIKKDAEYARTEQNDWIKQTLKDKFLKDKSTKLLVIFTHIPPYMDKMKCKGTEEKNEDEEGWATWGCVQRLQVLKSIDEAAKQLEKGIRLNIVFVCGHFHTNVRKHDTDTQKDYDKIGNIDIIVTSAAGSAMWWHNAHRIGWLKPAEAAQVAKIKTGFLAYKTYFGEESADKRDPDFDPYNDGKGKDVGKNLPNLDRSGMLLLKFCKGGLYKTKWYSIKMFREIKTDYWTEKTCGELPVEDPPNKEMDQIPLGGKSVTLKK